MSPSQTTIPRWVLPHSQCPDFSLGMNQGGQTESESWCGTMVHTCPVAMLLLLKLYDPTFSYLCECSATAGSKGDAGVKSHVTAESRYKQRNTLNVTHTILMVSRLSVLTRDAVDSPAYRYIQTLSPALALSSLINNVNGERILLKFIIPNCFRYVVFMFTGN